MDSSSSSESDTNDLIFYIGKSDPGEWELNFTPYLLSKVTLPDPADPDYALYVRKQKAKILPHVKGRRKDEVNAWQRTPDALVVPRVNEHGVPLGGNTTWDLATAEQIIRGIGYHFRDDRDGEDADDTLLGDGGFRWHDGEDLEDMHSRFTALRRKCSQPFRGDHIKVRKKYASLHEDAEEPISIQNELMMLIYTPEGATLDQLMDRAKRLWKAKGRPKKNKKKDARRKKKVVAAAMARHHSDTDEEDGDGVMRGVKRLDLANSLAPMIASAVTKDVNEQLTLLTRKVGAMGDRMDSMEKEARAVKEQVAALKKAPPPASNATSNAEAPSPFAPVPAPPWQRRYTGGRGKGGGKGSYGYAASSSVV